VVRQFIEATLLPRTEKTQVGDDEPLLDAGLIDSMGIFELATHIENTCGVKIEDEELLPENFNSINDIAAFVNRKRGS
jgi:acyl carrier protein